MRTSIFLTKVNLATTNWEDDEGDVSGILLSPSLHYNFYNVFSEVFLKKQKKRVL